MILLSRQEFNKKVFQRDNYKCVVCKNKAVDAHHIIERKLFDDGGYYIDNGVSVCSECHYKAEQTLISCNELRELAGIKQIVLPKHFYKEYEYDKWGNIILNNIRLKGEMFYLPNVQKILKESGTINMFTDNRIKYPRTYHLPWSESLINDDKLIEDMSSLESCDDVVVTVKFDGESCTMYNDYIHARSIHMNPHESRNWVKALHSTIKNDIPEKYRLCGENMFAKHSIYYSNLKSYFYLFSVWDDNVALSWDETVEWAKLLGLETVPVLYRGPWNERKIKSLYSDFFDGNEMEGYVIRTASSFNYNEFSKKVAKFVRKNHVQFGDEHWMHKEIIPNKIL